MVEKVAAKAPRKLKDKWKMKGWYSIVAPEMFNRAQIGETLAEDPQKLIGRVVEVTAQDLTGDFTKMHIKLHFKISEVKNNEANTFFLKQDLTSDYVRRLAKRKRTRIEETFDVTTKDRFIIRIRPVAITEQRTQSSKQSVIRGIMGEELKKIASESLLEDFVKNIISGQISKRITQACKPIHLVNRIEMMKTEYKGKEKVDIEEIKVGEEVEAPPQELKKSVEQTKHAEITVKEDEHK